MEFRKLGRTGLKVSALCLGTMQFGWTTDEEQSMAVMNAFYEAGGNFIDTAAIYSRWHPGNPGGVSEAIIGRWLKQRGNRRDVVIATKVRGRMWDGPNGEGLSRAHVIDACEDSLRRLHTDHIDLFQAHWFDAETPIEETLRAFDDLIRAGKVRYVGCSNYPAWRVMQALWCSDKRGLARFDSVQPHYSLVHRAEFERELADACRAEQLAVLPYSPLGGGFLTGKYRENQPAPESLRASGVKRFFTERNWRLLEKIEAIANHNQKTISQVALAWQLNQPLITAPIIGANNVDQLNESLGAIGFRLTEDEMKVLNELSKWDI